ncbi:class I SAM-dependent methyltransferase [Nitrospirota bacterium]
MSYKLYSTKSALSHNLSQWDQRTLDKELESLDTRMLTESIMRYLPANSRVIEGGCGLGAWCEWLKRHGHSVVGIEYFKEVVDQAKMLSPAVDIQQGDILKLDFPDDSFDSYVSLGVIEHFEEGPGQALNEMHRVLKDEGLAFVTVPYENRIRNLIVHPLRSLLKLIQNLSGKETYFWEYRYTKKELADALSSAGFKVLHVGYDDYIPEEKLRHIGIWADFFFLRGNRNISFSLNPLGLLLLKIMRMLPDGVHSAGILIIAKAVKVKSG